MAGAGRWIGRARTAEAAAALTLARAALLVLPFRVVARRLGRLAEPSAPPVLDAEMARSARRVALAVDRAGRRLPWKSTCLHRALAGALLLRRRGLPAMVTFGVARDGAGISAHAWLQAGPVAISGVEEAAQFTPIARFEHRGAAAAGRARAAP